MFQTTCDRCGASITDAHRLHRVLVLQDMDGIQTWVEKGLCSLCIQAFWAWTRRETLGPPNDGPWRKE